MADKKRKPANDDDLGFVADDAADLGFVPEGGGDDLAFQPDPASPTETGGVVSKGIKTLQAGGKILDYARGAVGGPALAAGLEFLTGKDVNKLKNWKAAINPTTLDTYPSSAELMEEAGVPEGAKVSDYLSMVPKDSFFDATLRGAGGFGLDVATDPLTYLSLGTSAAAKKGAQEGGKALAKGAGRSMLEMPVAKQAAAFATAPSRAVSDMGKKIFSWGITPIEQAGEKFGKEAVADTMYKHRIKGSARSIEEGIEKTAGNLKRDRDLILKQADAAGGKVELSAFDDFTAELDQMVADRRISPEQAEKLWMDALGTYVTGPAPTTELATRWKTDMYNELPQKAWEASKNPAIGQKLNKKAAHGLKEGIEGAVRKYSGSDAARVLKEKNKELGELLSVSPAAQRYAQQLDRRYLVTPWDVGGAGFGGMVGGSPGAGAAMIGAKKLLEIGRLPSVRTNTGAFLRDISEGPLSGPFLDILSRRSAASVRKKGEKDGKEK